MSAKHAEAMRREFLHGDHEPFSTCSIAMRVVAALGPDAHEQRGRAPSLGLHVVARPRAHGVIAPLTFSTSRITVTVALEEWLPG